MSYDESLKLMDKMLLVAALEALRMVEALKEKLEVLEGVDSAMRYPLVVLRLNRTAVYRSMSSRMKLASIRYTAFAVCPLMVSGTGDSA